ncbi:MAG: ATP synthase subunit [Actinobacteria bacterium]|nr:MAG: ATP synthase subunit [Actinomycetota bacterium]
MKEFMWGLSGVDWALMGAGSAAILGGIGSAIGITIASATVSGILSEDGTKFGKLLPIAAMPGTQGIYGFIAAVLVIVFFNLLGGNVDIAGPVGFKIFLACQPVAWLCLVSAIYQGMTGSSAAGIVAADQPAPALIFPALVETYAVLSLIVTILMLLSLQTAYMK